MDVKQGKIVTYVHLVDTDPQGGKPNMSAAIVTRVKDDSKGIVDLTVFFPSGIYMPVDVQFSTETKRGTWH